MTETYVAQVIESHLYSLQELCWELSKVRGRKVPKRTLRHWLSGLCIEPNEYGMYTDQDLQILTRLVLFLKRCRSIEKFRNLLLKEISTHTNQHQCPERLDRGQTPPQVSRTGRSPHLLRPQRRPTSRRGSTPTRQHPKDQTGPLIECPGSRGTTPQ